MAKDWQSDGKLLSELSSQLLQMMSTFPRYLVDADALQHSLALTRHQLQALVLVAEQDLPVTELARRIGIAKPNAAPMLRQLTQLGYVERFSDPSDGRKVLIRLTDSGRALLQKAEAGIAEGLAVKLAGVNASEARALKSALSTVNKALQDAWQ